MNNLIISAESSQNFDLSLTDTEILGHYIKKYFGNQTVTEFKKSLIFQSTEVLHSVLKTAPVENIQPAAQAAFLYLILLEGLTFLSDDRQINSYSNHELGHSMMESFWMYHSEDIVTWIKNAMDFYKSLHIDSSGFIDEFVEKAIKILVNFNNMIKRIVAVELAAA